MIDKNIALLIPAHNEEPVIKATINSLKNLIDPSQIFFVNDNSTDQTLNIAQSLISKENTTSLKTGRGKARALNFAIRHFRLAQNFNYIMPIDADTVVDKNYLDEVLKILEKDLEKKIACVTGKVVGRDFNRFTSFRLWEYEIGQSIIKKAQSKLGAIIVCSGCSTIYRSKIFEEIKIPKTTVTEDMDLTFLINRKNLGKIVYCEKARVKTQDPQNSKDYLKQIERWYTGFWQCILKYNLPWGGQRLDFEVALLATDGLINGILSLFLVLFSPIFIINRSTLLLAPFLFDLFLFLIPTLIFTSVRNKTIKIFIYLPVFYFMRITSSLIFLKSFLKVVIGTKFVPGWNTKRYNINESKLWYNLSQ